MMNHFVGLDVSQKMTAICVVDNAGRRVWHGTESRLPRRRKWNPRDDLGRDWLVPTANSIRLA
jgi:hypothetical protein